MACTGAWSGCGPPAVSTVGASVRTLATAKIGIEVWSEYDPLCPTTNLLMAPQPVCRRMRYSQVVCWLALVMGQEEVDADFN